MTSAQSLTWVLETEVFADGHEGLRNGSRSATASMSWTSAVLTKGFACWS